MKSVKKKIISFVFLISLSLVFAITAFGASIVIVSIGSSGWQTSSGSTFSVANCGYTSAGSYYVNTSSSGLSGGSWTVYPTGTGNDDYYVYIPSCVGSASVNYYAYHSSAYTTVNVNQGLYTNQFVYLGNFTVTPGSVNDISLYSDAYTSNGSIAWDTVKFVN
jgi:hypothetical protein